MIKNEPIIGVLDVEKSSAWYQKLLACKSMHGGKSFEMLADEKEDIFLCLNKWGEHTHPTMANPSKESGNGLILYLRVEDLNKIWENTQTPNADIDEPIHLNENSGKEQFCLRDLDGYYLIVSL